MQTRLDLGTDSEGIRSARSPDSTMTESTRLRLQKFRNEKVRLSFILFSNYEKRTENFTNN